MSTPVQDEGGRQARAVTVSDTVPLANGPCRALWVGVAGNVAVIAIDDTAAVTFVGVPAGSILPIKCKLVMSTNTTATSIVALY